MELDLEAVSRALERLVAPSTTHDGPFLTAGQRAARTAATRGKERHATSTSIRGGVKQEESQGIVSPPKRVTEMSGGTREILVDPSTTKRPFQSRPQRKSSPLLVPSPFQLPCRVIEASGLGASAVMLGGSLANKHHEEKVWTTNLYQTPNPYVVLNCQPKNYLKKEVVSHVAPTTESLGVHIERIRDIVISIAFDRILEDSEGLDVPVGHLVISCSNHPRTGYVSVFRLKDLKGLMIRAVVPGTLVGPFLKLTLFPKDTVRMKVVRVSAIELAHADSWTERRIIEEPLALAPEEDEADFSDPVRTTPKKSRKNGEDQHSLKKDQPVPPPKKDNEKDIYSSCNTSVPISSVGKVQEDTESVLGIREPHNPSEASEQVAAAAVQTVTDAGDTLSGNLRAKQAHSSGKLTEKIDTHTKEQEDKGKLDTAKYESEYLPRPLELSKLNPASHIPNSVHGSARGHRDEDASIAASIHPPNGSAQKTPFLDDSDQRGVSKALIAWGIKRQLLQDESVMRSLKEDSDGAWDTGSYTLLGEDGTKEIWSSNSCCQSEKVQCSLETLQARGAWNAVSHWSRYEALLEAMTNSTAFCVTIASTSDEVLASLPQPYGLQVLVVLTGGAQSQSSSSDDWFDLMMMIARGQRRRGRDAELVFRMMDGFGCILQPRREAEKGRQWLLVSVQSDPAAVNEWVVEALRVHNKLAQRTQPSRKPGSEDSSSPSINNDELESSHPPVLRSVLDFACLFESLLPALRPWLAEGAMCYYGDVQPALCPFIDECGVIQPTCWFHCLLQGVVRSVLLSLPGADVWMTARTMMPEQSSVMPPTVRRRLACTTLRRHIPFCAVWQPRANAVKTVLCNAHVLHYANLLNGVMMDRSELAVAETLVPHLRGKFVLLEEDGALVVGPPLFNTSTVEGPTAPTESSETTSVLAFQVLSTALRRSWATVGLVLSTRTLFDEDAFMDTVFRWSYALPRAIVLFFTECESSEASLRLSAGFVEAFASAYDLRSALAA
ncbi:hypothetical protein DQ04_01301020 [Trypanosoma grayi]|uniref:hypothetical protein n=1 Tax=Trypanosoma grayi TaxID=71804 RepID=UPI0004F4286D|nr:hypothetical protein DQ04_01301020 [Trypanosoma grayi]KEG12958.1 hypothetical protein DQ04_01301020 [Trypanosoma grayi]